MANPRPTRQWPKGTSGNPQGYSKGRRGRPPGVKPHPVVLWDLQQAAKDKSKRGLEILEQCMEDTTCDWPTRLRAIELLWERGYGRPQVSVDMAVNHNFCIAPDVMPIGEWLERKGQPVGAAGDEWLAQQQSKPPTTIDLKAEKQPEPELDQPAPPVDLSKLN